MSSTRRPLKSLGQNFLVDNNIIDKIIRSADIKPDDCVLEIGPGRGALTESPGPAGRPAGADRVSTMPWLPHCRNAMPTIRGLR